MTIPVYYYHESVETMRKFIRIGAGRLWEAQK